MTKSGKKTFKTSLDTAHALHEKGQVHQALRMYEALLIEQPAHAHLLYLAGAAFLELGQTQQGLELTQKALSYTPNSAPALSNLGYAFETFNRLDEALTCYAQLIALEPHDADAHYKHARVLQELKRFDEALASYNKTLSLAPNHATAYSGRGSTLMALARLDEALASFNQAVSIQADDLVAQGNRAVVLQDLHRHEEALAGFDKVLALQANNALAYNNRANVLMELRRMAQALAAYDQAIAITPDYANAHWNKSLLLLLCADFEHGWALYEWRWRQEEKKNQRRNFPQPLWLGVESLAGKTILLHTEQGLGDSIQFCRYTQQVSNLGARILLEAPRTLLGLFKDLDGVALLIEKGAPLPDFDYHCPLMSLPLAFKTNLDNIPHPQPYLTAQTHKVNAWRDRLGPKTKPRIGLAWSGNVTHKSDRRRSMTLAELWPHLPPEFEYVCLQKVIREVDQALLHSTGMRHFCDELHDFTDTAALCALMDVVISVDTSVAHLSAAIGRPTWVLLPYAPDWRWLLDRDDSPWYETVTLYRQDADWCWPPVLARVAADLRQQFSETAHVDFETALPTALRLHEQGAIQQALVMYTQLLSVQPAHAQLLYLLGTAHLQLGQMAQARSHLEKSLSLQPNNAQAWDNLGLALKNLHCLPDALSCYDKAIAIAPQHAAVHNRRGNVLQALERFDEALHSYDQALALSCSDADVFCNRGAALSKLSRFEDALHSYDQALALRPHVASTHFAHGETLRALHRFEDALLSYDHTIAIEPNYPDIYNCRGIALLATQRFDEARTNFDQAIAANPSSVQAHSNKGLALAELNRHEAALESFDKALSIAPDNADVYCNRGISLQALKRFDEALACYDKALAIRPDFAHAYANKGLPLAALKRFDEALVCYDKALTLQPDVAQAYNNKGLALAALKRFDAASVCYDKAIARDPTSTSSYWNKSLLLLLRGDYAQAWPLYEWRQLLKEHAECKRDFTQPQWRGEEPLNGKSILIYAEQGLGDSIQFCRYVKLLHDLGAKVIFEAHRELIGLFSRLAGLSMLIEEGVPLPDFDYHSPLMSLPLAFKTDLNNIPSPKPYLSSQPEKVAAWQQRLGPKTKPRVGLVWSGNPEFTDDHIRSTTLAHIWPHLPPEFEYVCLQKVIRDVDQALLHSTGMRHFCDELHDFTDTAALCELMDVVVSTCTSMAHLSAAIGRPTWIMLSYAADWRWLLDRDDSPWYETVTLYRQGADWRWESVLARVATDLRQQFLDTTNEVGHSLLPANDADTYFEQGGSHLALGHLEEAVMSYNKAIALRPDDAEAYTNLGCALNALGRLNEAVRCYSKALTLKPDLAQAYYNQGISLKELHRLDEAIESYDQTLAIDPTFADAKWNKSIALLLNAQFDEGWALYESRWEPQELAKYKRNFAQPLWLGQAPLAGQTILLHAEQGLGDSIQFCRYAKLVHDIGGKVLLAVPRELMGLLTSLAGVDALVEIGTSWPDFDYHCPLLSLPLAFKTNIDTIPSPTPYLSSQADKVSTWSQKLGSQTRPRVGLVWSGNTQLKHDHARSLTLAEIWLHLPPEFEYVCLQKVVREEDQALLQSSGMRHFCDELQDFTDTAALCELMDVVVSVDTSVAHLAAALGRPTWVMLPYTPDWRWLLDKDDSPWYASVKLYRQGEDRQWGPVVARVAHDLRELPRFDGAADFDALFGKAQGLHQSGKISEALRLYEQLLRLQPLHAELLYLSGSAHLQLGQIEPGFSKTQRSLSIAPDNAAAWANLGYAQVQLHRLEEALQSYDKGLALNPKHADLYKNRGSALNQLLRFEEAVACYDKALELKPNDDDVYNRRGNALQQLLRLDEALACYDKAIAIHPNCVDAHNNRGNVLERLNRLDESLASYDKAIAIKPDAPYHYNNRGTAFLMLGRMREALENFDDAISIDPFNAEGHWNKAITLLLLGRFEHGWSLYEWRWKLKENLPLARNFTQPLWLGVESLTNKTVLLHAEQGLGDSIQFCRYAKHVSALGAKVLLEAPKSLMGLFESLAGVSQLIEKGMPLPDFDYHCPLLSLPLAFKTNLSNIPSPTPYLSSQAKKVTAWQQRLGPKARPRVGLVWSGSPGLTNDRNRSLTLSAFWSCLPPEFEYVCLQKVVREEDQSLLQSSGMRHFCDELHDFADTAALCELMDVVVSVDTSVAHLAAALGRPTWVMLPYTPDWRWLLDRDDSPWYASVKLYRQGEDRQWGPVVARVANDLRQLPCLENVYEL